MARRTVGAEKARQILPELIEKARGGETTVITRRGKPVAAIVPFAAVPAQDDAPSIFDLWGSAKGKGYWGPDPTRCIREMRDEWER